MSVERRAAALMRERARGCAEPSPWVPLKSGAVGSLPESSRIAFTVAEVFPAGGSEKQLTTTRHIASWDPAVALAVADWLDSVADAEPGRSTVGERMNALAVARAYLRESD